MAVLVLVAAVVLVAVLVGRRFSSTAQRSTRLQAPACTATMRSGTCWMDVKGVVRQVASRSARVKQLPRNLDCEIGNRGDLVTAVLGTPAVRD